MYPYLVDGQSALCLLCAIVTAMLYVYYVVDCWLLVWWLLLILCCVDFLRLRCWSAVCVADCSVIDFAVGNVQTCCSTQGKDSTIIYLCLSTLGTS